MGKVERPIRRQIISSFYLILFWSIIATILTWGIIATVFILHSSRVNPANYYEKQIPTILKDIEISDGRLVSIDNKDELEGKIPLDGMDYQVLTMDGKLLFGSTSKLYIKNQKDLLEMVNTNIYDQDKIVQYYLVFDENENQIGAIGFRYNLSLASSNPELSLLIVLFLFLGFISPFVYFILFSYVIGKRFSKQIETSFNSLMEGAQRIQMNDLDFSLVESKTSKELNQLVQSFEDMRVSLKDSLLRQWKLEEERKEMVTAIAHDLRTPLTIIHGHAEGLLNGGARNPERLERYLQTIFSSTKRSIRLIDQLNDLSAIGNENFMLEPQLINIAQFVQYKTDEYKILCKEKNIQLIYTFVSTNEIDIMKSIDYYRVSQVLDNIMTNSIRYCPINGVINWTITNNKNTIVFEIIDNGPGFQQKEIGRVFNKFYRGDTSRSGTDSNFGLGLYIAQMIVKKHQGSISVENSPQGGALTKVIITYLN